MNIAEIIIAGAFIVPAIIGGIVYAVTTRKLEAQGLSWDGSDVSRSTTGLGHASWFDSDDETDMPTVNTNGAMMVPGTAVDVLGHPYGAMDP